MSSVILLISLFCISSALGFYTFGDNGRPECTKPEELLRPWRNNFDPTHYWVCEKLNEPGVQAACPLATGFMDTQEVFGCINWGSWSWKTPNNPPSTDKSDEIEKFIKQ